MGKYNLSVKRDEYKPVAGAEADAPPRGVSIWRLLSESRPESGLLVAGTAALLISTVATLAIPALFGRVIDGLTNKDALGANLHMNVFGLVLASLANSVFTFVKSYLFSLAGERLVARMRNRLFHSLLLQELGFFDQSRTGELVSRLGGDTTVLKEAATSNISLALKWAATVAGGITYLFAVSWKLSLLMLVVVPPVGILTRVYSKRVKGLSKQARQSLAEASEVAEESISNVRTVRSFAREERQEELFGAKIAETLQRGVQVAVYSSLFSGATSGIISLAFIAIVWYGGSLVLAGEISGGVLTSFLLYALTIGGALAGIAGLFGSMSAALGASERVYQLLDRLPLVPREQGEEVTSLRGDIEFSDVCFEYPGRPGHPVLRGLSLSVPAGSVVALVGSSGAGKSTVISLIERFYDAHEGGSVRIDGRDVRSLHGSSLRRHVGLVLQEPILFCCSIRENIAFGRPGASDAEVEAAARAANAHDFIVSFPDGYGTLVGERGQRCSGGQRQRIALARAFLQAPAILLLDESTSSLDSESEHAVQQALQRLMRGRTVVIVAHRLSTVRDADTIFVVDGGVVAASGPHEHLMAHSPLYANLVRRQLMAASTLAVDEAAAAGASGAIPGGSPATADAPVRVDVAPVSSRPLAAHPPALSGSDAHVELSMVPLRRAPVNPVREAAPDDDSESHQLLQRD